jgi:hypothetical protein
MSNLILANAFDAQSAIPKFTFVKPGSADGTTLPAAAASDAIIGVNGELDAASGERHDVTLVGVSLLVAGAAVTRGAMLTADAAGRGVTAAAGNRVGAVALESAAAAGDLIRVLVNPFIQ